MGSKLIAEYIAGIDGIQGGKYLTLKAIAYRIRGTYAEAQSGIDWLRDNKMLLERAEKGKHIRYSVKPQKLAWKVTVMPWLRPSGMRLVREMADV